MIETRLKQCCCKCNYPDIEVDSRCISSFLEKDKITHCTIYCTHEKVCKEYIESEEESNAVDSNN